MEITEVSTATSESEKSVLPRKLKSMIPGRPQSIRELACNLRDAVVTVTGQVVLTNESKVPTMINQNGNGFFIKGHYIICPAALVLIGPMQLAEHGRIPAYPNTPTKHKYPNALVRVSRILVDVSNVNGSDQAYSYEADIVGIDGAANIAILRVKPECQWNAKNPVIRVCHPFLQWGKSRSSCSGDTVMLIGNITAPAAFSTIADLLPGAENAVTLGTLADNRYVFPAGHVPGELLLLSNMLPWNHQQGLPVLTTSGTVIGMVIKVVSPFTYNIAVSEFFMRRPIKALIRTYQDNKVPDRYVDFVRMVDDPIGSYYSFNKAWLGIAGTLMSQMDYDTILEFGVRGPNTVDRFPILEDGSLITDDTCKEIVGYRVTAVAQSNPKKFQRVLIPGAMDDRVEIPSGQPSPLVDIISPGDIITHINDCPLGDRKGQISPSLAMWRVRPGDEVTIQYKNELERFRESHQVTVATGSYEPFLDFPFYCESIIPFNEMVPTLL